MNVSFRISWFPKSIFLLVLIFQQSRSFSSSSNKKSFASEVFQFLNHHHISWDSPELPDCFESKHTTFIRFDKSSILLHLIPTPTILNESLKPTFCKKLTDWVSAGESAYGYNKIIHLHQDVWLAKNDIVKARLLVQLGAANPKRIFARKTVARRVNATFAMQFLEENHLWGPTKAKYYYGLFEQESLVAVATFSSRRKVQRMDRPFKSHELLRYCSQRNATVIGGISKLCKKFIGEVQPDDIVTVVDRDWGDGSGWHSMCFETVSVMDPLVMMVNPNEPGVRRHLVGAGIQNDNVISKKGRMGLPTNVLLKIDSMTNSDDVMKELVKENFFPVYDTGVERLLKIVSNQNKDECVKGLWQQSHPKYASAYYANNTGITSLLQYASSGDAPLDSSYSVAAVDSWRKTSGTAASAKLLYSTHSSMDADAKVEVRERANGWRTVGLVGSTKNPSIYHGIYKVDQSGNVEPTAVVSEFIKTMAVLSLAGQRVQERRKENFQFLHFGYGAGTLVRLLASHVTNSQHVAIELDSGVVDASNQLLPSLPNVSLKVGDALDYTWQSCLSDKEKFDCVCIDVFDEDLKVPEAFYSEDFLKHLSGNLLTQSGILVQNFHSGGKKRKQVLEKASHSSANIFAEACWVDSLDSKEHAGNKILLASKVSLQDDRNSGIQETLSKNALMIQSRYGLDFDAFARVQSAQPISYGSFSI